MWINTSPKEVFEYTGNGQIVPKDVVRVQFHCSITDIEDRAFGQPSAFEHCVKLKEVVLNIGLQTIGMRAFASCESLESIAIPSTVTEIGMASFYECKKL